MNAELRGGRGSLLVFSDDWGRHPSSCQHLVAQLLAEYPVCWVNTIGTRRPALNLATVRRGLEKAGQWLRPAKAEDAQRPAGLKVVSPKMWPWFSHPRDRWLNRRLLLRGLAPIVEAMPQPVRAITTLPIVADLVGSLPVQRWVYYCVDDFSVWPGLDQQAMAEMEQDLVSRVDVLLAVSENLQERLAALGREAALLTHGVDLDHWQSSREQLPLPQLGGVERPLAVFWGVVDQRMDVDFLRHLAGAMREGTIVLAGPQQEPDPALWQIPRVHYLPPLPYNELPRLAAEARVLIMPYRDLPVTRAMQPLKLKEYLATGKPVVVRQLPAAQAWADYLEQTATAAEFSAAVRRHLETEPASASQAPPDRLRQESWAAKARQFQQYALA